MTKEKRIKRLEEEIVRVQKVLLFLEPRLAKVENKTRCFGGYKQTDQELVKGISLHQKPP